MINDQIRTVVCSMSVVWGASYQPDGAILVEGVEEEVVEGGVTV